MTNRLILIGTVAAALGVSQIPNAPNTQPKPVNDPTNTSNITGDPTVPGSISTLPSGNPGIGSNPSAALSDQAREAADQIFATNLTLQDMTSIELGKLVAKQSSNDAVKKYATQVITNNGKMIERLKRIASRGQISIPGALDTRHQGRVDKLAKLSGDEFDKAFAHDQVQSVERNLKSFEQEIQNGADPNLKTLATRSTPGLQKQLQDAKDMEKALKGK